MWRDMKCRMMEVEGENAGMSGRVADIASEDDEDEERVWGARESDADPSRGAWGPQTSMRRRLWASKGPIGSSSGVFRLAPNIEAVSTFAAIFLA